MKDDNARRDVDSESGCVLGQSDVSRLCFAFATDVQDDELGPSPSSFVPRTVTNSPRFPHTSLRTACAPPSTSFGYPEKLRGPRTECAILAVLSC